MHYNKPIRFNPFGKEIKQIYGPYRSRSDERAILIFWFTDGTTTSMLRSRWKMTQKLRRKLLDSEDVDHIDDDFKNDRFSNLQVLSPQANLQKQAISRGNQTHEESSLICPICGKPKIDRYSKQCMPCYSKSKEKINWPPTKELKEMIEASNCLQVAKILGVSNSAVKKRIRNHPE